MDSREIKDYTWVDNLKQIPDNHFLNQATGKIILMLPLKFKYQPCPHCFVLLEPVYGGDSVSYSYCPNCAANVEQTRNNAEQTRKPTRNGHG